MGDRGAKGGHRADKADLLAGLFICQIACGSVIGCSNSKSQQPSRVGDNGRPGLALADTVVLVETDRIYIGRPGPMLAVGPGGDFFVPDQFSDRVVRFSRRGAYLQAYGRRGTGPGEMTGVGLATVVVDSLVVQATMGRMIYAFRLADGQPIGRAAHRGFIGWGQANGDNLVFGNFDPYSRHGVLVLPIRRLFDHDSLPASSTIAPFPAEYRRFPGLDIFNSVAVASWADTILVSRIRSHVNDAPPWR